MARPLAHSLVVGGLMAAAFLLGQVVPGDAVFLGAQGRQPDPQPRTVPAPTQPPPDERIVYSEGNQTGFASNGMIAVTGSYRVGGSVLYLVDTVNRQIAVYEARGGASGSHRLELVGARRIDLDLQLEGYNDESEFRYEELRELFARRDRRAESADGTGEAARREGQGEGRGRDR